MQLAADGPIRYVLIALITAMIVTGLNWLFRHAKPVAGELDAGAIRPDRITASITVAFGSLMVAGGIIGLLEGGGLQAATILAFGTALAGFMAPSLTNVHTVTWSAHGIVGPCKTFGLTLGAARATLKWQDLARGGKTASSYWFVEASNGQRVYWSYLYPGHGALADAIRQRRPDLALPDGM